MVARYNVQALFGVTCSQVLVSWKRSAANLCFPSALEPDSQVTLTLHLPERPVKDLEGIPNPESTLPVTLTPTDPLNEIRATLTELPDCYWLGSYVFRKAVRGDDGKPKRANGKSVLSDKLPEFTELHNIFDLQSDTPESVDLYVTHGTFL